METREKINEVLNKLIRINHDRAEGYDKAINRLPASDNDLKYLFRTFVSDSNEYADSLSSYVLLNGGNTSPGNTMSGKIYRMWMDVRLDVSGKERKSVLASCEFGEDATQRAYELALGTDVKLPADIRRVIISQRLALKSAHDEVKHYRDLHTTEK